MPSALPIIDEGIRRLRDAGLAETRQIVQRGRHDELFATGGLYARLWQVRERASRWHIQS